MENNITTYLKTISFSEFNLWDVKRFVKSSFTSKHNTVELDQFISERSQRVKIFDFPDEEFGILGVNNNIGLFDAYSEIGRNINQAYKRVEEDDLTYNPYRINVGSIGWKTKTQKNSYISPAYVVFECKSGLTPEFLYRMFQTNTFNEIINDNTTGSVRQNLKFETLTKIKIPLPSLSEQNRLVENYNKKISLTKEQEKQAKQLEIDIENYLFEALGIKKLEEKENIKGLQFVNLRNLDRWDVLAKDLRTINALSTSKYPLTKLGASFSFPSKSWKKKDYKKDTFNYIELGAIDEYFGITEIKEIEVKNAPSRATQQVSKGDLIIGTTRPYLKRFAIVSEKYDNDICSSGFSVIEPNPDYDLNYLKEFLFSYFGIEQLKNRMTGGTYPAITNNELKEVLIPFPPAKIQKEIANHISNLKQQIKDLKTKAEQNRENAIKEFEQEIFTKN